MTAYLEMFRSLLCSHSTSSRDTIFDLQYADDAAIPSHTAAQHSLDLLATSYQRAGLIVNTKKTEVLAQSVNTEHVICSASYLYSSQ